MKLQVIEVSCDDWSVLYVDGKITEYEGHRLGLMEVFHAINDWIKENSYGSTIAYISGINYDNWFVRDEYTEEGLPEILKDIPEEMFE